MSAQNVPPDSLVGLWQPIGSALAVMFPTFAAGLLWLVGRSYRAEFTDRFAANEARLSAHETMFSEIDKRVDITESQQTRHDERIQHQEKQLDRIENKIDKLLNSRGQ